MSEKKDLVPTVNYDSEKWDRVVQLLARDPLAMDATLSLFAASAHSSGSISRLKPFPPMFRTSGDEQDIQRLCNAFRRIPSLHALRQDTAGFLQEAANQDAVELLCWLFRDSSISLQSCHKSKFAKLEASIGKVANTVQPDYVFEVCRQGAPHPAATSSVTESSDDVDSHDDVITREASGADVPTAKPVPVRSLSKEETFSELCDRHGHFMAYHGTQTDRVYSIMHNGLLCHLNERALFGYGSYLATALPLAMSFSTTSCTWQHSVIGDKALCVVVCDIADDPSQVRRSNEDGGAVPSTLASPSPTPVRGVKPPNGRLKTVPEKYVVVRNNDLLQVKYVLVYGEGAATATARGEDSLVRRLWRDHKFAILMCLYGVILAIVGIINSKSSAPLEFFSFTYGHTS